MAYDGSWHTVMLGVVVGAYFLVVIKRMPEMLRSLWRSCARMVTAARRAHLARGDSLDFEVTRSQKERSRLLEERSQELADARQIKRCILAARVGLHMPGVAFAFVLHRRILYDEENDDFDRTLYGGLCLQVCLLLVDVFSESNIRRCHLDVTYTLLMALFASATLVTDHVLTFHFLSRTSLPARLLVGLACTRMSLAAAMNLGFLLMTTVRYLQQAADAGPEVQEMLGPSHSYYFCVFESFIAAVSILLIFVLRTSTVTEARAEVMMHVSDQVGTSLRAILSALCDAVVCVGADGAILSESTGLNTLLMRCDGNTLEGSSFLDLVHESDQERLVMHLDASMRCSNEGPAASLHLTLRGACSSQVRVQLFNARLRDIDGKDINILGIQELSREEGDVLPLGLCERGQQQQKCIPSSPGSESADSGGSSGVPDFVPLVEHELPGAVVWVDALSFQIQKCNADFAALCGPVLQGVDFRNWLGRKDFTERAVQDCVQEFLHEPSGKRMFELGRVVLEPPLVERVQMEYHASGWLIPELGPQCADPEDLDLEDVIVVIVLGSITACKKRSSRSRPRCKSSNNSAKHSASTLHIEGNDRVKNWPQVLAL